MISSYFSGEKKYQKKLVNLIIVSQVGVAIKSQKSNRKQSLYKHMTIMTFHCINLSLFYVKIFPYVGDKTIR